MSGLTTCEQCPFRRNGGAKVGSKGPIDARVVLVGESPGVQELKLGLPFVGPSGEIVHRSLAEAGIDPAEVFFTNAMQCFPGYTDEKNEGSLALATQQCQHRLHNELYHSHRDMIIAMGNAAVWGITNDYSTKITQMRGVPRVTPFGYVIPTVHPSFLMRGGRGVSYRQYCSDLAYAQRLLLGGGPLKPPVVSYEVARNVMDLYRFRDQLIRLRDLHRRAGKQLVVAADIETGDFSPLKDGILCAGFATSPNYVFVVPEELVPYMGVLFLPDIRFAWHNGKFDIRFCHHHDIPEARVDEDTMLLNYALDETGGVHDLETVSSDYLNSPNWKAMIEKYLAGAKKKGGKKAATYRLVPRHELHQYMAFDIGNTKGVYNIIRSKVAEDKHLEKLYTKVLMPASRFLANVERNGIYLDREWTEGNGKYYDGLLEQHQARLDALTKPHNLVVNANSHVQVKELLFDVLRFKAPRGKRSSDKKVLEKLPRHPIIDTIRDIRNVKKSKGTYVKAALEKVHNDGKIHTTFKIHGTRTGRLSSEEPNLQNQPRLPRLRGQYIATPGRRLVEVDLNQAELRILACLSGDTALCRIYSTKGLGLHDEVRAAIWGHAKDWSSKQVEEYLRKFGLTHETRFDEHGKDLIIAEQKMRAKNVNFGVVYGITSAGLAEQADSTPQEAQSWLDAWAARFPEAWRFLEECGKAPLKGMTLVSPFGNKRRFGVIGKERMRNVQNEAKNFPMQGPASHCTLLAGIAIEARLRKEFEAWTVNLIHDALLNETPDDDETALQVAAVTKAMMEQVPIEWGFKRVPFIAEAKMGYRWGSLKEVSNLPPAPEVQSFRMAA
jgi:uracil-DNA glycosylase family 4